MTTLEKPGRSSLAPLMKAGASRHRAGFQLPLTLSSCPRPPRPAAGK